MAPTLSVIIPVCNGADFVAAAIATIEAQERRPDELIVVDDGSTDTTVEVVSRALGALSIPARLIQQRNAGVAVARNAGLLASHGELLAFVDADDLLAPEHFATALGQFDRHPEAVVVFCNMEEFDRAGPRGDTIRDNTLSRRQGITITPVGSDGALLLGAGLTGALCQGNFIPNSATIIRRRALAQSGAFDPALEIGEDRDLYMRLSLIGPFIELTRVTARQRRHPASTMATRDDLQWAETSLRLLAAFRDRYPDEVSQSPLAEAFTDALQDWSRIALSEAARNGTGRLRRTANRIRQLGVPRRMLFRHWARALQADLTARRATPDGVDVGRMVSRATDP